MDNRFLEALHDRIGDYFDRNRDWFDEYFFLLEKFDRETNEFYYIGLDKLFVNPDDEMQEVISFLKSEKAKGNINDAVHHTSGIYRKYNNNTLMPNDFPLKSLDAYFKKNEEPQDLFVLYKKKLLYLKICECDYTSVSYFSFPLFAYNTLHGSIHILFHTKNLDVAKLRLGAMFRNTVTIFTEYFENILSGSIHDPGLTFQELSIQAIKNTFLRELDYPNFYISRSIQENENTINRLPAAKRKTSNLKSKQIHIQELVSKGDSLKALDLLEELVSSFEKNILIEVLTLKANLANLNKDKLINIISSEEYRRELNKINYSILQLSDNILN